MPKLKITVLKRMFNQDLADKYCANATPCARFTDGQEFLIDSVNQPPDFCYWAWHDIYMVVSVLMRGGDFMPWMKDKSTIIACCSDGIRPVVFEIKKIEG